MMEMVRESYEIYSVKNTRISCASWQSGAQPKAVLFIVHGLGEHLGRYEETAEVFVENDLAVFAFDHRGHGRSKGKKGHARSVGQIIEDTEYALMKCRSIFLEVPIFIYGHSMGGQIAASFLKKVKSKEISGAIISSAWFKLVNPPPAWQIKLTNGIKRVVPNLTLSNGLDPGHISTVPEEVELYRKDSLVHDRISFAMFRALYRNGLKLLSEKKKANVPVLVCHGDKDKITSCQGSKRYAKNLGGQASFKIWPGSRHEPHHDKDKEEVIRFYVKWIKEHVK
ncbi:MAG: lysophospholipase [Cytophagales bacterium]|nr:lysophospholipase [Cytophagales bacterium]